MRLALGFMVLAMALRLGGADGFGTMRFDQRIGEKLPMGAVLTDETGHPVRLGDLAPRQPLLVIFGYFECTQLCSVVESGALDALREIKPTVGRDFAVLYISIDPSSPPEAARAERDRIVGRYGRTGSQRGFHYLTGAEVAVRPVADAAGFHYAYDREIGQYAHPVGFLVATPDGVISRYFLGLDFRPAEVAAALDRAAKGETGESTLQLLITCFHGGGITGPYGAIIWRVLEVSVSLTVGGLGFGVGFMLWQERRARRGKAPGP